MKGKQRFFTIFTLGLLSAMGAFSIDMYLPGFPAIAKDLHTTVAHITLSITSFFIGISVGQMIYGPLLDKFGRKKPLYIGLVVYLITSVACAYSPTANALIGLRFLQALGSCAGMVASRALVRDIFPVNENAKIFSLLMLVLALSPIVAPTLGGYMTSLFGWQSIFFILASIAVITLLLVYFKLPPGRKPETFLSLLPRPIIIGFLDVAKVPQFYTYAFAGAIASSGLYAYIAGSPFVFMELYHVTEKQYGWIFSIVAMGLITASQVNNLLLRKYTSEQIIKVTLFIQTLTGMALVIGTWFHQLGLYSTIFLILIFLSTQGFAFPNSSALCLAPFSKNAGTASALMGAIQLGIGAVSTALVSIMANGTPMPMAAVMFTCAASSFVVLMIGRRIIASAKQVNANQNENSNSHQ
jgi:DHA1 family bicyclomycin/chloramphenicol resistance-like MFS transporter